MATYTPEWLYRTAFVGTSSASIYTNPASTTTLIKSILFHNIDTSVDQDVRVWIVPNSGGSVGTVADSNRSYKLTIPSNDSVDLLKPSASLVFDETNDSLHVETDNASKVTVTATGITRTA